MLRDTLIHAAARAGDVEELARLIAAGADVNTRRFSGETPLMCAARDERACPGVLRMLIAAGADLELRDEYGGTALMAAVCSGNLEKVSLLVEAGSAVRALDNYGHDALSHFGDRAIFDYLLEHGADCNHVAEGDPDWGSVAKSLYCANRFHDLKHARARGTRVDSLKLTPLMEALLFGTREELEAVLARRPNLEATDFRGATALLLALSAGNLWAVERLLKAGASLYATHVRWTRGMLTSNALRAAIETDEAAVVTWVLEHGFSVDASDEFYESPLLFAVEADRVNSARALLDAGASIHKETRFGEQPINKAGSLPMLELLIERGADVNHIDSCGQWPLAEFAFRGNAVAVEKLLAAGAEADRTSTGETALLKAVFADDAKSVKLLLDAGANVNAHDVDGWSALFSLKSLRVLRLLVAAGIDFKTTIRDQCNFPAWHWIDDRELADEIKRLAAAAGAWREEGDAK